MNATGSIDLFRNDADLFFDRKIKVIKELELRFAFTDRNDCFSKCTGSSTTLSPMIGDDRAICTSSKALITDE